PSPDWLHADNLIARYPSTDLLPPPITIFFFNDPPTPEIYTLSLHDALPISRMSSSPVRSPTTKRRSVIRRGGKRRSPIFASSRRDRKSTRLNSSHVSISYAVFCLKKKNTSGALGTCKKSSRFLCELGLAERD